MRSPLRRYKTLAKPARAVLWFLLCGIVQKGIGIIVTPVFTRIMTTEEYGLYTLFNSWLEILGVVLTLRLSYGVFIQGLVRYDHDKDRYTSALQGLTTLLVLVGLAIYLPFRGFWNGLTGLNTFLMLCVFASTWATAMFGFWSTRQRVAYNYRLLVAVTLVVAFLAPASGVIAVLSVETCKVEARVACIVVVDLAFYTGMFAYYMAKGRRFFDKEFWLHALRFNVPLVPHYLSQSALSQADRVMINSMVGSAAAGVYGLASSVSGVMAIVNQAIMNAMNPWIYQKIRDGDSRSIASVSYIAIAIVGVANLVLIAFAPEVIGLFAPEQYQIGIWVVPPLAGGTFLMFMYSLFADFEFYFERTAWVAFASVAGAIVNIVLNLVFIPLFGFVAAGYTTLASYGVYIAMHYAFMRKVQKVEMGGMKVYDLRIILGMCILFAFAAALLVALYPFLIARMGLAVAMLAILCWKRNTLAVLWNQMRKEKR